MSIGLLGQKIGMTSVYDASGRLRPVTVIAAGDNVLMRRVTADNDGYSAIKVGFGTQKESRLSKQMIGEFKNPEEMVVVASDENVGQQLVQALQSVYPGDIPIYKLGAVVGTYAGPGTAGVAVITARSA